MRGFTVLIFLTIVAQKLRALLHSCLFDNSYQSSRIDSSLDSNLPPERN